MEKVKQEIAKLVEKYNKLKAENRIKDYNEAQTLSEFIEPLFSYLGWDIHNINNPDEVTPDDKNTKGRVDRAFRINGIPKFFLEAKSMKSDLDIESYARQAINYSWNKGVTWAVLTDFEGIKVFNAQAESKKLRDKIVFEISCENYISDFEKLWLLSKESFDKNKLDEYAEGIFKKAKKLTVDKKLFEDLKKIREILSQSFGGWNANWKNGFNQELLDEGVQRIIDRLIFIRVLEDRQLEPPILKNLLHEWEKDRGDKKQLFDSLIGKFRELNGIYNSSLFKKHFCEDWEEYSDDTKKVIPLLYGSDVNEYDFKGIPADILGGVYESYLGYIAQNPIKAEAKGGKLLQSEGKAEIKEKSRKKRKEQGIYYTPKFIVDYIIQNTLGEKLKETKSINDLKKIRVLDPACGSGSFLTKAMEAIKDKYKYFDRPGDQNTKTQILMENIYGVDLDSQAVELAKLNLLIDALDKKEKLPDLEHIKIGNSLISGGEKELQKYFGKNWRDKKPFNWREKFPEVFAQGGFDVIIGNPPYIKEFVNKSVFDGLHDSPYYQGKMDLWTLFACVSIDLLRVGGILSFIAPSNWITNTGASIFRNKILKEGELKTFIDFGDYKVFEQAGIQTMIFVFEKKQPSEKYTINYLKIADKDASKDKVATDIFGEKTKIEIEPNKLIDGNITFYETSSSSIFNKIQNKRNFELNEKEVGQGIVCPQESVIDKHLAVLKDAKSGDGIFVLRSNEIESLNLDKKEDELIKPFYTTEKIARYYADKKNESWIIYSNNEVNKNIDKYPKVKQHLQKYAEIITSDFKPFGLHRARDEKFFIGPSIFSIRKTERPQFSYVDFPCYVSQTYFVISTNRINLKFLTGLLNSQVVYFWLKNKGKLQGDLLQVDKDPLMEIPICVGNKKQQKVIIDFVDKMLELNKQLKSIPENSEKWNSVKAEIEKTDKEIDQKVYELYGLTEDEIKIVECEI